jgi:hypothetical protein
LENPKSSTVHLVLQGITVCEPFRSELEAGEELRVMMDKLAAGNIPPMTMDEIQAEVNAVRKARKTVRRA